MELSRIFHNKILKRIYPYIRVNKIIEPKKDNTKRLYLFGVPEHLNYGDIAIFVAEMKFLKENLSDFEIITIPERLVIQQIPIVKSVIKSNDIIALHGGGNMGDIWPFPDKVRQSVIRNFGDNYHLVSFPQSISYSNKSWIIEMNKLLENCIDISIFARDNRSFEIMKNEFPSNVKVFLVPDIVMDINIENNITKKKEVLFLMRRDKEKLNNNYYKKIKKNITENYKYKMSDTVGDIWYPINRRSAPKRLNNKLEEIQKARLVVTDRLHGMIFSYVTKTPVIVFDNNNHKIKNFYNTWFNGKDSSIFFLNNNEDLSKAIDFARNAMNQKIKVKSLDLDYSILVRELSV